MGHPAEAAADVRRERRQRVFKRATILNGINKSEVVVTLRNMHEHGCEMKVPAEAHIPEAFLLYVPVDSTAYVAELRWRDHDRAGVRFTGTAPKPHWHYG